MKKIAYWVCFTLVAVPTIVGAMSVLLNLAGIRLPIPPILSMLLAFGSLVPEMLASIVPGVVGLILSAIMVFLVFRRIWLMTMKGERVPASFRGFPKWLAYVGVCSIALSLVVLAFTIVLRAGSGVPAGMLLLPAIVCVPWAFFLTEVFSFRTVTGLPTTAASGRTDS